MMAKCSLYKEANTFVKRDEDENTEKIKLWFVVQTAMRQEEKIVARSL